MRAFSATTLLLLLSFCLLAPAPGAFAIHLPGSEEAEFQWHREQLEADLRKPEALLHLNEVFASRPYVRQPEQVRQCLERTAANAQAPDLLKGHAIWFLSILDMEVGRLSDATARRKALGFVCDWLFIGPFDNENKAGFATPYPPEGKIALDQTYPGKQNEVRWRSGHGLFPFGEVYLHDVLRPAETVVGYALTFIHLPEPRDVAIRVGSDDAIKVFIDGQPVITHNAYHPAEFDQVAVGVRLTAGWHRVLVKLCQSHGDWVFMLRVTTPSGAPLPLSPWQGSTDGSSIRVLADATEIEKLGLCNVTSSVSILPAEDPLRVFQARIQANPKDADAHAHLAHYCAWKRNFDGSERRHITELEAAVAIAPWYPYYHLLLGYLHEDFNARRRALEKATALAPNFGRALYGLAAYNAERKLTDKALEFAEKASQADPDYLAPRLLLARLHSTHFLRAKALQTAQTLAKQYPGSALLQREMARYCEMLNMQEQAEQAYRRAAELDSCSRETRRKLIQIAKDKGDLHAAIAHCDALLQRWPSDASLMLEKADLLATHSQYEQAISLSMAALDLCPHNATALEKLGHFQHRLGQLPAAMNNWQEALALMPQNAALKEYVEFLTPQEDAFEQKYVLDKDALLRLSTE
ncbi:MAG: hypothetical protein FJ279_12825, partial [Planctomycetes bacterium]|nr:hypothetical protein [Planctomycetota bacterium]